ncbi:FAD monooxygenase-like protein [Lojkania enalia]|uniref:FAD monooxygenase-like protein n=1 Tax=Lojkania enalia TaxID=147567 RepID=A0A9P4TR85_9PLEO|nr:FAD monooxygenase-like protein [Didymosphaeria enalia]
MPALWWNLVKRNPSQSPPSSKIQKMAPGLTTADSTRSSFDVVSTTSSALSGEDDYSSFLSDVVVVGAGPSGLLLADSLVRFGVKTRIIDDRADATTTGRADGIQPKTIETLKQMRMADPLLRKGVRIYDIAFWVARPSPAVSNSLLIASPDQKSNPAIGQQLRRTGREIHYPPIVDLLEPYILLVHQGMVENLFIDDLKERGVDVTRTTSFMGFEYSPQKVRPLQVVCKQDVDQHRKIYNTRYLVGCDGAHSRVRKSIPDSIPIGASSDAVWGVLDGVLDTDFPDIWSKVVVHNEQLGSILMIPRERNMTRLYIELKPGSEEASLNQAHTQEFVQQRATQIMQPYRLKWKNVEWFGRYTIRQGVASKFTDPQHKVFIAGDASHTHSPKAAQGMNTSMHDSWNLAWKLNFAVRGLAKPSLLDTYEQERKKIANDLINFDYEHANAFAAGDPVALAENFAKNVAFISGYGVTYDPNVLNVPSKGLNPGLLEPGYLLPPARVTRYIDANPVDIQTDIPALGQFRIYIFAHNVHTAMPFLDTVCSMHQSTSSYVGRVTAIGNASYTMQPPLAAPHDQFVCPERYTPISGIFTYALVTDMDRNKVEIEDLPFLLRDSRWTFYLDDVPHQDTRKQKCLDKWLGGLGDSEVAIVNVRPDGYVGCLRRWVDGSRDSGLSAVRWMDRYYEQFLVDS